MTVEAAVVIADLRGFTALSEQYPRDALIALLNEYFDALCEPVERFVLSDGRLCVCRRRCRGGQLRNMATDSANVAFAN